MTREILDWFGCYRRGWGKELVPGAYSHPAKVSFGLAERIYAFLFERGLLVPEMIIVDPFAGIGGFAYHALKNGLHFRGCELEPKFVTLGQANIDLWNSRYAGRFVRWGTACIVQGDSRHLRDVLRAADVVTTSPPFGDAGSVLNVEGHVRQVTAERAERKSELVYGSTPGNLGNLPARDGDLDVALTSPPYVSGGHHPDQTGAWGGQAQSVPKDLAGYGKTDGQMGQMQEGNLDAALTSPPFLQTSGGTNPHPSLGPRAAELISRHAAGNAAAQGYGESESNLGNMREGNIDIVTTSPPFSVRQPPANARPGEETELRNMQPDTYGESESNLGNMREGSVDIEITSPPYADQPTKNGGDLTQWPGQRRIGASQNGNDGYGDSPAQLASLPEGRVDAEITSPPYEHRSVEGMSDSFAEWREMQGRSNAKPGAQAIVQGYGETEGQIAGSGPDTFWSAARQILAETHALLRPYVPGKPGGVAVFVVKSYVRAGQLVDFPGNWRRLAESVGFVTLYEIRAWVTEDNGTQLAMDGNHKQHKTERKSFFRRLAERKGSPRIDYETVLVMTKPGGDGGAR